MCAHMQKYSCAVCVYVRMNTFVQTMYRLVCTGTQRIHTHAVQAYTDTVYVHVRTRKHILMTVWVGRWLRNWCQ